MVPNKKREGEMDEVKLGFIYRLQLRPPVGVGDDDVTAVREVVGGRSENCIPRLGEILKGEEEHEPSTSGRREAREGGGGGGL